MPLLTLHTMSELDSLSPTNASELLLKIVALNVYKIGGMKVNDSTEIKRCPFLKSALRGNLVWVAALLTGDWQEVTRTTTAFLQDFLNLEPKENSGRAVVIFLPNLPGYNDKIMEEQLDGVTTALGLSGYYEQGLMPGSLSLPLPPPPARAKFLLPMLIIRHMVREDDTFIREGSKNPAKEAAARAAYRKLFGREP